MHDEALVLNNINVTYTFCSVRTSNMSRTIDSMEGVLAGMFGSQNITGD